MKNLLFEIGTEELPAGFLQPALDQLSRNFKQKANELELTYGDVRVMGTPRRLALLVSDLIEKQQDRREELLGPSKQAGFDSDGNPTKAAMGFARSKGCEVSELQVVETEKGEYLMLEREVAGQSTEQLLPDLLYSLILECSFAKSMRWGSNKHAFGRPIQWLLALFGDQVVSVEHEGILSSGTSMGHRFMANSAIDIESLDTYEQRLLEAHVIVDPSKRREKVIEEINHAVSDYLDTEGAMVAVHEGLADTVTNLVEWPYGVCGSFEDKFLELPDEVLITSMREHQKYFPVTDGNSKLLPAFVAVNNTRVTSTDLTRTGHERVLRARLEDALFFFNSDRKNRLDDRYEDLSGIIFQNKLGTMLEKSDRIVKLTSLLAEKLAPQIQDEAARAAQLCKIDLLSDMVGEFPSLQGTMGAAYAANDGEPKAAALAVKEHYMPKRAGAELPSSIAGALVGLADRFDTIAGCFGIGEIPTGTADPFGLRRLSLACLHIIEEKGFTLSLSEVIHKALALYGEKVDGSSQTVSRIVTFIKGRFVNDKVANGSDPEAVDAVTSVVFDDVNDCVSRIKAFEEIKGEAAFPVLASSFKRIRNIIKDNRATAVDGQLFESSQEKELQAILEQVSSEMKPLLEKGEYFQALKSMMRLKEPVDHFFDHVMVMADDPQIRQNRLNLLTITGDLILKIGDISKMHSND